jgi:GGDEF domain-containing protein
VLAVERALSEVKQVNTKRDSSGLSGLEPALAAAKTLWEELWRGGQQAEEPRQQREIWSPEAREYYRNVAGPQKISTSWYPIAAFCRRLGSEIEQAKREDRTLSVIVFQLPETAAAEDECPTAVEMRLRSELRPQDLPTRVSERVLAVALPGTGAGAVEIAARLERALSSWAGGPVSVGTAHYPQDGHTATDLLRRAFLRSMAAATNLSEVTFGA